MKKIYKAINLFFYNKWVKFFLFVVIILASSLAVCFAPPVFESKFDIFNLSEKTFEFINSSRSIVFTILGFSLGFLGFSYRFVLEKIQINYFKYTLNDWSILFGSLLFSYLILSTYYLTNYNSVGLSFLYFIYYLFVAAVVGSYFLFKPMIKVLDFKSILDKKIKNIGSIFIGNYTNNENTHEDLEELKSICFYYIKIRDYRAEYTFQHIFYYYCNEISRNQSGGLLNEASDRVIKYAKEFFEKSIDIALSEKNTPFITHQLNSILEIYKIANTPESDKNFNNFLIRKNIVDQFIVDYLFNNKLFIGYEGSFLFRKLIENKSEKAIFEFIKILEEMLIFELNKNINDKNNEDNNTYKNSINFINNILQILSNAIEECKENKKLHANVVRFICKNLPSNIYSHFEIKHNGVEKDKFKSSLGQINLIDTTFNGLCDIHIDIIKNNSYDISYLSVPFYLNSEHFNLDDVKNKYINLLYEAKKEKKIKEFMFNLLKSNIK